MEKEKQCRHPLQANMIISVWTMEDAIYYTLTFTSAGPETQRNPSETRPSSRTVLRANTSFGKPIGPGSSSSPSGRPRSYISAGSSVAASPVTSPVFQTPAFPPNGPPARTSSSTHSVFRKATQLKDAILNSINMPAYAMWKDESFGIPNKALINLMPETDKYAPALGDQREFLGQYTLWTEDFKAELSIDEFPIIELCRSQRGFSSRRIGMKHPKTNAPIVFEVHGEPVLDEQTGEFLGGIAVFKDVTEYTKRIAAQVEENERQFEYIANLIPIMVWRTTPTGHHDWFSKRWYDYTGLSEEESFGEGWMQVFHKDDMAETEKRWLRSLATGDEYITEYRCRRNDREWRWMLGRAVPFRDSSGTIIKWFGTCTVRQCPQLDLQISNMTRILTI
jgi:PAS domain S-box-containing protein